MNETEKAKILWAKRYLLDVQTSLTTRAKAATDSGQGDIADGLTVRIDNLTTLLELIDQVDVV